MNIVPIVTKDDLSKEQIEYLQKQQTEYKLIKKVKYYSLLMLRQGR